MNNKNVATQTITIPIIGYASGLAANDHGCCLGPIIMQQSPFLSANNIHLSWLDMLYIAQSNDKLSALPATTEINERLANLTYEFTLHKQKFIVIGGDHSCAIGTWSGVAAATQQNKNNKHRDIGLLWIDAHMDSHTPQTTITGNIHGMPLAALLGHGASQLTQLLMDTPKLKPEHVCLVGVRSYEKEEAELLKKLGVRIFFIDDIKKQGLNAVMQAALAIVTNKTAGFGLSIDLDAIDPAEAPGVSLPEPYGINSQDLLAALSVIKHNQQLLGLEMVEFNPNRDQAHKTEKLIAEIINVIFS